MEAEVFRLRKERWGCDIANVGCFAIVGSALLLWASRSGSNFLWVLGSVGIIFTVVHTVSLISEWRYRRRLGRQYFDAVKLSRDELTFLAPDGISVFTCPISEIKDLIMVQSRSSNDMIIVCRSGVEFSFPVAVFQRLECRRVFRKRLQELVRMKFHYVSIASRNR